jgi:hypothetical protein
MAGPLVHACTWIRVSIDAADPVTYMQTHAVDKFEDAWEAVKILADAAKACPNPATIGVGYLLGEKTLAGMYNAAERARDAGANYIQFRPFVEEASTISAVRVAPIVDACRRLERPGFSIGYLDHKYCGERLHHRQYDTCHGAHFTTVIQADGHVALCCLYRGKPEMSGGSILERPFPEIWEGERMAELRRIDVHKCPPLCRHDTLNELVETILQPKEHANFL